jgi:hypothetical protein
MDLCERCGECSRDYHEYRKDQISDYFVRRLAEATQELDNLRRVFRDVCWFNFEVHCRAWRPPWPQSIFGTRLKLHGYNVQTIWVNGRRREYGTFPVYYDGPVHEAPPVPPQILMEELALAVSLVQYYKDASTAPYDWAPGGSLYQELLQTTLLPTQWSSTSSEGSDRDKCLSKTT